MFSGLASVVDRRPWRVLAVALAIVAVAAPLGIHVREHLKPRGFDVAGSGSARARKLVAQATKTDPANSVLALVRLRAPIDTSGSERRIAAVKGKLRRDPAVAAVLDWRSAHNPAMVAADRRSTYLIAALRRVDDKEQEQAGKRLLAAFADDPRVTLGGSPVANEEISKTIEDDLRRAELLAVPLIVLLSFFLFRGLVASLLAPIAGGITVIVSFFLLRELASLTPLSIYALNLVTGLSIGSRSTGACSCSPATARSGRRQPTCGSPCAAPSFRPGIRSSLARSPSPPPWRRCSCSRCASCARWATAASSPRSSPCWWLWSC